MTPEAERFLQKAKKHLERGHTMLSVGLNDEQGGPPISQHSTLRKLLSSRASARCSKPIKVFRPNFFI